jgi:hypothetical protein
MSAIPRCCGVRSSESQRRLHIEARHSIARDQRPLSVRPKSARHFFPVGRWGCPARWAMSMLFRRLDVPSPFGARHRQQRHPLLSADLDVETQTTRSRVVGVICRRRDPATTWSSFSGPGRDPSREFPKDKAPRLGRQTQASALGATIALRHDDAKQAQWRGGSRNVKERPPEGGLSKSQVVSDQAIARGALSFRRWNAA